MNKAINVHDLKIPLVECQGKRVVTFAMVDEAHQRPKGTASATFRRNRHRFVIGRHYFEPSSDVIRRMSLQGVFPHRTARGVLITEMGYLLLVKPFNDDLSWLIQEELVNAYFRHIPQFPELKKVTIPELSELAAMPLYQAQHAVVTAGNKSFTQHGQKGSAAMRLRRNELGELRIAIAYVAERSQLRFNGRGFTDELAKK